MEGSPRMIRHHQPNAASKFQPASASASNAPLSIKSNSSTGVSFNKKTIRNYTPQASSNFLREFEDRRNNSVDWREKRSSSQPPDNSTPISHNSKGQFKNASGITSRQLTHV